MKRFVGFMVAALIVAFLGYGLYYIMLWEHSSPLAQREWLETLFREKGFTVGWVKSEVAIESFFLTKNENSTPEIYQQNFRALQVSSVVQFYERRDSSIFFIFGKRVSILEQTQGGNAVTISLFMPETGQVSFALNGGGEFVLGEIKEMTQLFNYPEVRSLRTRPLKVLYASWGISGAVLAWGIIAWIQNVRRQRSFSNMRVPKAPVIVQESTRQKTRLPNIPMGSPPLNDSPQKRVALLAELASLIEDAKDPGQREKLLALHGEMDREKRISLIRYAVQVRAQKILHPESQEDEESQEVRDASDVSLMAEEQGNAELIELRELEDNIPQDVVSCARRILLFLLRPGGIDPYMGERRVARVRIQRKLVDSGTFSYSEFMRAYNWLIKQGVILQVDPHESDDVCSINPHKDGAKTSEGKEIIGILIRTRQKMVRER